MMAFFYGTKKTKLAMAFILILTLVISYAVPMSVFADSEPATKDFKVNLFNYDKTKVNNADLALSGASNSTILAFHATTEGGFGAHSTYHGSSTDPQVYTGIVKNSLNSSGTVDFATGIKSIDLFSTASSNSNYAHYSDVAFPFTYNSTTGYYEYDSAAHSATFDSANKKIDIGSTNNGGFWPFGKTPASGTQTGDFHFGMSMAVNFYIPDNRTVDGKTAKDDKSNDLVFTFKGDDDVWIFVDDQLVLDIGGIHNAAEGSIDFTTGKVTTPHSTTSLAGTADNAYVLGLAESKAHTLKVFYLERGAGESNLKMNFNIPPVEPLTVEKKLGGTEGNFTTDAAFDFVIETGNNKSQLSAYGNAPYEVQNAIGEIVKSSAKTDANGGFTLKAGQKAIFKDITDDDWFSVHEVTDGLYNCAWGTPSTSNLGVQSSSSGGDAVVGKFEHGARAGAYALVCTNTMATTDVTFHKIDSTTESDVSGAAFMLTATGGVSGSAIASSDKDGKVTFSGVPKGEYTLKEIAAPTGYLLSDKVYTVVVDYNEGQVYCCALQDSGSTPEGELGFVIYDSEENEYDTITNDQKLDILTITKKVQGADAPENNPSDVLEGEADRVASLSEEAVKYSFTIRFDDGYTIASPEAIVSSGAFDLDKGEDGVYTFDLVAGGFIKFPIQEGVIYRVYEHSSDSSTYKTYYSMTGDDASSNDGRGIYAKMTTTSALSVLNQYPNDGLTVMKSVEGNTADPEAAYDFKARFWIPESQKTMETTVLEDARKAAADAETSLGAIQLTQEETTSLAALRLAVTNAGIALTASEGAMNTAEGILKDAEKKLADAIASKGELQTSYDNTSDPAILVSIGAIDISGLTTAQDEANSAYESAKTEYGKAVDAETTAKQDLETFISNNPNVKVYLDALAAYEAAQADFDDLQVPANLEQNIFEKIWDRIVGFFINLVVGETYGEGVNVTCAGSAADFDFTSDSETSGCAFSLKAQDTATFNFDQYFDANPNVDRVYFEITETGSKGAESVTISAIAEDFPDAPAITGKTIKGYVDRETMNPVIEYTNTFKDVYPRSYTVIHKTDTGIELASSSAIGNVGDSYSFSPSTSFTGYTYSTVSAVGIDNNADSTGKLSGTLPSGEGSIVVVFTYTETSSNDTPDTPKHHKNKNTTIVEDVTPASPVTPEAITPPETSSVIDDVIPAGPLPKTGGVAPYLIYGLGLLLAGGGVAMKRKSKKED